MRPGLRLFAVIFVVIVVGIGGATGYGAVQAAQAATGFQSAGVLLARGVEQRSAGAVEEGLIQLQQAMENAQQAQRWLFVAQVIPRVHTWSVAVEDGLVAGREVVAAGQELVVIMKEVQTITGDGALGETRGWAQLTAQEKRRLIQSIEDGAVRVLAAQANIQRAIAALEKIDQETLPKEVRQLPGAAVIMLRQVQEMMGGVAPFVSVLSEMAGADQPTQWLILYLNNTELRPGGGFIGFYALATVENGEITTMVAEDSYATDLPASTIPGYNVRPPQPLAERLGVSGWFFRDSAWSPDFAETAATAVQLLRQQEGVVGQPVPSPRIVLGITPQVAADIVERTGPLQVGNRTLSAGELYDVLQYDTQKGFAEAGRENDERKLLVGQATKELITRLMQLPPEELLAVWQLIGQNMVQKNAALYSAEPRLQQAFADSQWAGTLPTPQPGKDFLALIDANLGALKTDPAITRKVKYTLLSVDPEAGVYHAVVQATYRHDGSFDYKTTRYQTYAQLLVPPGARLLESTGGQAAPTTVAAGYTSFPQWIVVEPGQEKTVLWSYELPADIVEAIRTQNYQLTALKQIGGGDNLLTLDHTFDRNITTATPAEQGDFGDGRYELTVPLTQDMVISVGF